MVDETSTTAVWQSKAKQSMRDQARSLRHELGMPCFASLPLSGSPVTDLVPVQN